MKMKRKKVKKIIIIILAVVLVLELGVFGVMNYFLGKIQRITDESMIPATEETFETDDNVSGLDVIDPSKVKWDNNGIGNYNDDGLINILLVGQDRREGQGRQRSDTMIVLSFNPKTNQVSMISFLRDLYVQIPGYSDNRLNAAYVFGGFELLKQTLKTNFCITIDGCFEVDFTAFKKVIDMVGGVDVYLTDAEAQIIGDGATQGVSHLDGDHALMYARIRKIDSDFNRTARQRNIVKAVFDKVKGSSVSHLLDLLNTALPYLKTDMSNSQIMSLAIKYASSMSGFAIATYHVPAGDCYQSAMIRGMAVLVPDLPKIRQQLFNEYLPIQTP
jgi:LCP family protein required for cell wall assembly